MTPYTFDAHNEEDTRRLGARLADCLPDGSVVSLLGTLGAGKTRLVQAIAEQSGVENQSVVSPTFVLIQEYQGRRPIYHFDAYRLADDDEFLELGPDEYFESSGISLVEWADRVESCMPPDRLEIRIEVVDREARRFELTALGTGYEEPLKQVMAGL